MCTADRVNALQRAAVETSRLGIPLLIARDVIHGHRTVFPIPLGQAASFDAELVRLCARAAAREASADGVRWTFAPMVDIAHDPRWGRVAESWGEDPWLSARLGAAAIEGFQGGPGGSGLAEPDSLAACAKHYVGYGLVQGGRDYAEVDVGPVTLHDRHMRPFAAAVDAGVATVMTAFHALDRTPMTAHARTRARAPEVRARLRRGRGQRLGRRRGAPPARCRLGPPGRPPPWPFLRVSTSTWPLAPTARTLPDSSGPASWPRDSWTTP